MSGDHFDWAQQGANNKMYQKELKSFVRVGNAAICGRPLLTCWFRRTIRVIKMFWSDWRFMDSIHEEVLLLFDLNVITAKPSISTSLILLWSSSLLFKLFSAGIYLPMLLTSKISPTDMAIAEITASFVNEGTFLNQRPRPSRLCAALSPIRVYVCVWPTILGIQSLFVPWILALNSYPFPWTT